MARTKSRELHDLIKSLDKNEKRYFKVMFSTTGSTEDRKMLQLFDFINKEDDFNEHLIPEKLPSLRPTQLSNLKAYLHEKLLQSLRQFHLKRIPDIRIREQIDFVQLLMERRQYAVATVNLKKAKKMARQYHNFELQLEILRLEKELLLQTDEAGESADRIINEVHELNSRIHNINLFSNLAVKLNSLYRKIGFIRDESEYLRVKEYFLGNLPVFREERLSGIEKAYLYRLFTGYYFYIQDFDRGYFYARKLEKVFEEWPELIRSHPELFLTSINTVLNAEFKQNRFEEFVESRKQLEKARQELSLNENLRIRLLKYYYLHQINLFFLQGTFDEGVGFIRKNASELDKLSRELDLHSGMILSYKLACVYFGASEFHQCIRWLNRIINLTNIDIREDLHCFARILNLICHYEVGNFDVIKYYILSTYRFLLKKDDLHLFQKYILTFLKNMNPEPDADFTAQFQQLKEQLLPLEDSSFEKRAFIYFDIISWLQSKIEGKPVQEIIRRVKSQEPRVKT